MNNLLIKQYELLLETMNHEISILSNTSAFIYQELSDVSWAGFYLVRENELILGPFNGKVACSLIEIGKGVCGTAADKKETIIVEDVHKFAGHIACDSASNSEIVIPIIIDSNLYGVLDLDSTSFNRFTTKDKETLEKIVEILINKLKKL